MTETQRFCLTPSVHFKQVINKHKEKHKRNRYVQALSKAVDQSLKQWFVVGDGLQNVAVAGHVANRPLTQTCAAQSEDVTVRNTDLPTLQNMSGNTITVSCYIFTVIQMQVGNCLVTKDVTLDLDVTAVSLNQFKSAFTRSRLDPICTSDQINSTLIPFHISIRKPVLFGHQSQISDN